MPSKIRSITINGVNYDSLRDVARAFNVSLDAVYKAKSRGRLETLGVGRGGVKKTTEEIKGIRDRASRPIFIQGVEYPSIKIAAEVFGVSGETIVRAEKAGRLNEIKPREVTPLRRKNVSLPKEY